MKPWSARGRCVIGCSRTRSPRTTTWPWREGPLDETRRRDRVSRVQLRFLSRPVWVRVEQTDTPFTCLYEKGEVLEIPVAHGDGRYVLDPRTAAELEATDRVVWRYVRDNPNGSTNEIAGVTNAGRNVVGIMPHPERRDAPALGGQDGARVFHSMEARHATH